MKLSYFKGYYFAVVASFVIPVTYGAATRIEPRDFKDDLRNFNQITQTMKNIRSLIGVPFTTLRGLPCHISTLYLAVQPENLILLPPNYPSSSPNGSSVEDSTLALDENLLLVACQDLKVNSPFKRPMMRLCPEQERVLKDFLVDLKCHGNRLAISRTKVEKAPILKVNQFHCMPKEGEVCWLPAPTLENIDTASHINIPEYLAYICPGTSS